MSRFLSRLSSDQSCTSAIAFTPSFGSDTESYMPATSFPSPLYANFTATSARWLMRPPVAVAATLAR